MPSDLPFRTIFPAFDIYFRSGDSQDFNVVLVNFLSSLKDPTPLCKEALGPRFAHLSI